MSVVPSSASSVEGSYYFPLAVNGILRQPISIPVNEGMSGTLEIRNYDAFFADPSDSTRVIHYMTKTAGGGLSANHYQLYMYGVPVGGNNIGECWDIVPLGNNRCAMAFNNDGPLEDDRMGKITGTGALQAVSCLSISLSSTVRLAFVAGTPAGADPVIAITAGTGFSLTLPAGAVYNYEVIG